MLANKETKGVQEHLDWLLKNDSDRVVYRLLKAHLAWQQKDQNGALKIYEQALEVYPHDLQLGLDYAEKLLQHDAASKAKAKTVLLSLSAPSHPTYYRLLAQAYQETGAPAESQLALAESYYLDGQTALAVEQLKQARQQKKLDYYMASRIEARYNQLKQELREEQEATLNNKQ